MMRTIMRISYKPLSAVIVGLSLSLCATANNDNFLCRFEITEGQQAIRKIALNKAVYACLQYDNYGDLTIVNSDNKVVPLQRLPHKTESKTEEYSASLDFYPEPETTAYQAEQRLRRLATIPEPESESTPKKLHFNSFILRNNNQDHLHTLSVKLKTTQALSAIAIVEASNNLQDWRQVTQATQLYFLDNPESTEHSTENLQKHEIALNQSQNTTYFRFALFSNTDNFINELDSINAHYRHIKYDEKNLEWISPEELQIIPPSENISTNNLAVTLPGLLPISQLKLSSPVKASVISGLIYAEQHSNPNTLSTAKGVRERGKEKIKTAIKQTLGNYTTETGPNHRRWLYRQSFNWNNIEEDKNSDDKTINLNTTRSRHWKVLIQQPKTLDREQFPTLYFGWQATEFVFIAEGDGPFYLLAGNDHVAEKRSIPQNLLNNTVMETVKLRTINTLDLPTKKEDEITTNQSDSPGYLRVLLWLMILLGVGFMGMMAYRLFQEMNQNKGSPD